MLYFAYGSNMDARELHKHCPSAEFVTVANLPDHRLAFSRYSAEHNTGLADAVPQHAHTVWGVVYDVPEMELGRLDRSEGHDPGRPASENAYLRVQRHVYRDGQEHEPICVWIYLANREPNAPLPNSVYKGLLVDGAKFWHLPPDYIEQLERIENT